MGRRVTSRLISSKRECMGKNSRFVLGDVGGTGVVLLPALGVWESLLIPILESSGRRRCVGKTEFFGAFIELILAN